MLSRLLVFFRRTRLERDLDDEIAGHLAMQEAEFRASAMSAADARTAAVREFGGVSQTKEEYRERRGLPWLKSALRDARYALRGLRRSPGFAAAAVLSLATGIGANLKNRAAILSNLHALPLGQGCFECRSKAQIRLSLMLRQLRFHSRSGAFAMLRQE